MRPSILNIDKVGLRQCEYTKIELREASQVCSGDDVAAKLVSKTLALESGKRASF